MSNRQLFSAKPTTSFNEAGGPAYVLSAPATLARYAVTGTFHRTYYAEAEPQLETVASLAQVCHPEFVAKVALYAREQGTMKDMPAFLVAHLATRDVALMSRIFPRIINDGRMLRNFVQIVRSGVTGRKSFGSAPKRAVREWFSGRSPDAIFRQSLGQSPSMSDVIKMVRPPPRNDKGEADAVREALYGYLIGKNIERDKLPPLANAYEAWRHGEGPMPDVPFEMLTAWPLTKEHWKTLAARMTTTQLRMNLNTLLRHGVLDDDAMVEGVATRLEDRDALRRARTMPYQLLAAYRHVDARMPKIIVNAISQAMEHAVSNVPAFEGSVVLCPDVSGSMQSALTGHRGTATTTVRCVDVAALVTAAVLRRNPGAAVVPFSDDVVLPDRPLNPLDSVLTNAERLASLPSGGTACSAPLRWLNARGETPDVVVMVSDNQSWSDYRLTPDRSGTTRGTVMAEEWQRLRSRNPKAKLVLIDLQPYRTTQMPGNDGNDDVLHVGGFSDAVFDVLATFTRGELTSEPWLRAIEGISL